MKRVLALAAVFAVGFANASGQSSPSYHIPADALNSGVANMSSPGHRLSSSVGDTASGGVLSSQNYRASPGFSSEAALLAVTVPDAPTGVFATAGNAQVTVTFTPPASDGGSPITSFTATCGGQSASAGASPITVTGLANGTPVTCAVTATNALGTGPASLPSNSVTPLFSAAPAITSAALTTFTVDSTGSFTVQASGTPTPTLSMTGALPPGVNFTPATGVLGGKPALGSVGIYPLTFGAANGVAPNANQSFTLTIAKASQAINFVDPGTRTFGAAPFVPTLGATSGLAVMLTSNTPAVCSVASGSVTLLAAGTCTLTATQAGDANYDAAVPVQRSFIVAKASQTITFADPGARRLSATPLTLSPGATSGLPVTLASDTPTICSISGGGLSLLAEGTCTITASQAGNANYEAAPPVQRSFTITAPPRLFNISTRMQVLTGNDRLIAGFIVGGATPKTVVINVAGPSLVPFGITNALMNPTLTLVRSSDQSVIATNDDWQSQTVPGDVALLQGSGFQPNHAAEPAIIATLPPGAYTAIVEGAASTTGVGLVGVFEVDHPELPLINISTRGQVLTGNDVMIAGFIVQGDGSQKVVVNVAGPSLVPFGITNALTNPKLTIVRSSDQSIIATNDDWQAQTNPADVAAIQATGFQPNNAAEPALLLTLPPGAYTAIVEGVGGSTGVGLVGVFAAP